MARIGGVELPKQKRIEVGLTYIYGIGLTTSQKLLKDAGVDPSIRVKDLSESDVLKLRDAVRSLTIEGDLRRQVSLNVKRLVEIGCYRGQRHRKKLPVRGQRTKTNARTNRSGKKIAIAGKKKVVK